ncbi:MAG: molybdopterin-binding protein [Thermodesulfovibrionales bacterium]
MRDMLGRQEAVSVREAQRLMAVHLSIKEPKGIRIAITESYRRILSEDIYSPEDLPAFSRSTVDGFAVDAGDTFGATEGLPSYLSVTHEISMGEEPDFALKKGTAAKIATGGMLPMGANAVVMFEHVQYVNGALIEVLKPVAPKENVISKGEDVKRGELILKKGSMLRAQDVAALAAVGITRVEVYEKPRVSIISTGDEIVSADSPLLPGRVRDVNSYNLYGLTIEHGGLPIKRGIFKDIYEDIERVVKESLNDSDMVLISGGSSVGMKDMTSKIIDSLGPPGVIFHGVALKPGKPTIGAVVNGIPVFGLPGHPAAVTVCFELFVKPVLRVLTGICGKDYLQQKKTVKARMARNISSSHGREEHVRVAIEERDGGLWAVPVLGKSGLIRTLVMADGTVVIPPEVRGIEEGEIVEVILF